jgi:uncharacterized protein YfdQ (DUF2303 family)
MDRSAIDLIQQTAIDANANRLPRALDEVAVTLPKEYTIHDLERYGATRRRFRGTFSTKSLPDFVAYVKRTPNGQGFIDDEQLAARVFFNLGDVDAPGHADWQAYLDLPTTPAYDGLLAVVDKPLTQRNVSDFIEDWLPNLGAFTEDDDKSVEIPVRRAVAAIRKIKIEAKNITETQRENFRAAQSSLDSVEASSDAGLPDVLTFTATPYLGLAVRTFRLRLSILTGGPEPRLVLRIIGKEQMDAEIAEEFKALLLREVGDAAPMSIGSFDPR